MDIKRFEELKGRAASLKAAHDKCAGAIETVTDTMASEFGATSAADMTQKIADMQASVDEWEASTDKIMSQLEELLKGTEAWT